MQHTIYPGKVPSDDEELLLRHEPLDDDVMIQRGPVQRLSLRNHFAVPIKVHFATVDDPRVVLLDVPEGVTVPPFQSSPDLVFALPMAAEQVVGRARGVASREVAAAGIEGMAEVLAQAARLAVEREGAKARRVAEGQPEHTDNDKHNRHGLGGTVMASKSALTAGGRLPVGRPFRASPTFAESRGLDVAVGAVLQAVAEAAEAARGVGAEGLRKATQTAVRAELVAAAQSSSRSKRKSKSKRRRKKRTKNSNSSSGSGSQNTTAVSVSDAEVDAQVATRLDDLLPALDVFLDDAVGALSDVVVRAALATPMGSAPDAARELRRRLATAPPSVRLPPTVIAAARDTTVLAVAALMNGYSYAFNATLQVHTNVSTFAIPLEMSSGKLMVDVEVLVPGTAAMEAGDAAVASALRGVSAETADGRAAKRVLDAADARLALTRGTKQGGGSGGEGSGEGEGAGGTGAATGVATGAAAGAGGAAGGGGGGGAADGPGDVSVGASALPLLVQQHSKYMVTPLSVSVPHNMLDFGLIAADSTRSLTVTVSNTNCLPITLNSVSVYKPLAAFLSVHLLEASFAEQVEASGDAAAGDDPGWRIMPGGSLSFRMALSAPVMKASIVAPQGVVLKLDTGVMALNTTCTIIMGGLKLAPLPFNLEPTFAGRVVVRRLMATNSYAVPVRVVGVASTDPRVFATPLHPLIAPNATEVVAVVTFDAAFDCPYGLDVSPGCLHRGGSGGGQVMRLLDAVHSEEVMWGSLVQSGVDRYVSVLVVVGVVVLADGTHLSTCCFACCYTAFHPLYGL